MNSTQSNASSLHQTNNSTEFELDNIHDYLYGSIWTKIFLYWLAVFITHVIGPILLSGMIIFETCGGDPQKRNVINRLLSLCWANQIMFCLLLGGCRVWRGIFGLIDINVMKWIEGFAQIFGVSIILFYDEMTILRFLYIVVWKRVIRFDDQFWTLFLSMTTYLWGCCYTIINKQSLPVNLYVFKMYAEASSDHPEALR